MNLFLGNLLSFSLASWRSWHILSVVPIRFGNASLTFQSQPSAGIYEPVILTGLSILCFFSAVLLDLSHVSRYSKSVPEFELRNLLLEAEVGLRRLNPGRSKGPESLGSVLKQ